MIIETGDINAAQLFNQVKDMLFSSEFADAAKEFPEELSAKLAALCRLAENLYNEFDVERVCVNLDTDPALISMIIDVDELVFNNGRTHYFFGGIKSADVLSFSKSNHDGICIKLGIFVG